jgi:hypothetical protein
MLNAESVVLEIVTPSGIAAVRLWPEGKDGVMVNRFVKLGSDCT